MRNLYPTVFAAFMLLACSEEPRPLQADYSFEHASAYPEYQVLEKELWVFGSGVIPLSSNETFRKAVYEELETTFDGDYNVLIEYLIQENIEFRELFEANAYKLSKKSPDDAKSSIQRLITDRFGENEQILHPQIYIPNFPELRESGLLGKKPPVFVFYAGDESLDAYKGYEFLNSRIQGEINQVDEEFSAKNEVWVISLNERFFGSVSEIGSYSQMENVRVMADGDIDVDQIVVKSHKESWAAGASEVHIRKYVDAWQQLYITSVEIKYQTANGQYEGDRIVKASRKDVKKKKLLTPNVPMIYDWEIDHPDRERFIYVIFEYDAYPAGIRTYVYNDGYGNSLPVEYRSSDTSYIEGSILRWNFPITISNSTIECSFTYN